MNTLRWSLAVVLCAATSAPALVLFDARGFEAPTYNLGPLLGQNTWSRSGSATATVQSSVAQTGSRAVSLGGGTDSTWYWPSSSFTPVPGEVIRVNCSIRRGSNANATKHVGYRLDVFNPAGNVRIGAAGIFWNGEGLWVGASSVRSDGQQVVHVLAENLQWDAWYDFQLDFDFDTQTYDVTLDAELLASGLPFPGASAVFGDADFHLLYTAGATDLGYFDNYLVQVLREPAVRAQPGNRVIAVGDDAYFDITASGARPLSYQWQRDGSPIAGATTPSYTLPNCQLGDSGSRFACVVTNAHGAVTSTLASLTVFLGPRLCEALDDCTLTWISGGAANWVGQTTNTLDGVDAAVSGPIGDKEESWVETVVQGPGELSFSWGVEADLGFDFLEFRTNGILHSRISGVVSWQWVMLRLPAGPQALRWTYVKDAQFGGGADRGVLDLVQYVPDGPEPLIVDQPQDQTVVVTDAATFSVGVSGAAPFAYQWLRNGEPIAGATRSNYSLLNCQFTDSGNAFSVRVSNAHGTATSWSAFLTVTAGIALCNAVDACDLVWRTGGTAPWTGQTVETHDGVDAAESGLITHNQQSWMETTVEGPGTLTFWWRVSSEAGRDFLEFATNGTLVTRISGAGGNWAQVTHRVAGGTQTLRWSYTKDGSVSAGLDRGWLDQVGYVADDPRPVILGQPQDVTVGVGGSATFSVVADGRPPLSYAWQRDGAPILGATAASYTLGNCQMSDSGSDFDCVVSNEFGATNSAVATLTVDLRQQLTFSAPTPINVTTAVGPGTPYPSILVVGDAPAMLVKVTATLHQLSHTAPDDLDILLVGPQGQKVMLMSDAGGSADVLNVTLSFDPTAATTLPDSSQIFSGTYLPTDFPPGEHLPAPAPAGPYGTDLYVFVGTDPRGEWRLYMADDAAQDAGSMAGGWSLKLTLIPTPEPPEFLAPYLEDGEIVLSFETIQGLTYVVEWTDTMPPGTWTVLQTVTGDGTIRKVVDSDMSRPHKYYILRRQ